MKRKIKFIQSCEVLSKIVFRHVEQFYDLGLKVGMLFPLSETMDSFDRSLWTNKQLSFIPHGTEKDPDGELQPVYLATESNFPNFPNVLLCVDCVPSKVVCDQEVVIFSSDSDALETIRQYYKSLQNSMHEVSFIKE